MNDTPTVSRPKQKSEPGPESKPWHLRIGPGLITACVVIGPGSIMTSSTVGANKGYSMLWVVMVSAVFMLVFMTMGAKLGAVADRSPGDLIRRKAGRPLAILVGCCVFFISAAFQSGNNIGVAAAVETFTDSKTLVAGTVIALNVLAILVLVCAKEPLSRDGKVDDDVRGVDVDQLCREPDHTRPESQETSWRDLSPRQARSISRYSA